MASPAEVRFQKPPGVRRLAARHLLRRAGHDDLAAGVAAFRAEIDDVVGGLDHVHVMLDEQHRVAGVDEPVQRLEQALDVGEVQAGGRLVEDVDGVLRRAAACSARSAILMRCASPPESVVADWPSVR